MNYKSCLCILLLCLAPALVKADRITKAYKKLLRHQFAQAKELLDKALEKNPQNAGAKYMYALYFLDNANPVMHLDSAYTYVLAARNDFPQTERKSKKQWNKVGINEENIIKQKLLIDSLAYSLASDTNTIIAYQYFIDHYPTAAKYTEAIEKRNALAFTEAKQVNTYQSYKYFLDTYPDARQVNEAKELYDVLLFDVQTKGGTIKNYEAFITAHPKSPFKVVAEQRIFEMYNAPHTIKTYQDFIKKYPSNSFVSRAWNWIYVLYKQDYPAENFLKAYPDFYDQNYIRKLIASEKLTYYPVYEEEKYGFIDANGTLQIPIRYDSIVSEYFCEGVKEDFILVANNGKISALDKTGKQIINNSYEEIEQLEEGLLLVQKDNKYGIYHQAGFQLLPAEYDEVNLLDEIFLLVSQNGKFGLTTVNGRKLTPISFDEISSSGEKSILFQKEDKYTLLLPDQILQLKDTNSLKFPFTKVEWIKKGYIKVYTEEQQSILTSQLTPVIPFTHATIKPLPAGWSVQNEAKVQIYTMEGQLLSDSVFTEVNGNAAFYAVQMNDGWAVLRTNGNWFNNTVYDAITLLGNNLFIARQKENLFAYSQSNKLVKLGDFDKTSLQTLPNYPGESWVILENKRGKKGIYASKTDALIPARYDDIQVWEPNLYKSELKGKFGLIDSKGKILVPATYDGLDYQEGLIAILKNGKFGLMNLTRTINIPAQYNSLLKKYDQRGTIFIAAKDGKYGLISADNKPLSAFDFDEVRFWQSEVALVKQGQTWYLYHLTQNKNIFKPIDFIQYIKQEDDEILLKIYIDKMYGILSNTKGLVINCEYDDLRNVGSASYPLYVGEKYVDNADVYLVFYINREGKPMRRQIFSQDKYNQILCE